MVDFIEIKTFPYSGVDKTPKLGSKLPSSPPHTDTACVFGNKFFNKYLIVFCGNCFVLEMIIKCFSFIEFIVSGSEPPSTRDTVCTDIIVSPVI